MFGCIIDSGRSVKNGSSLNPSGGVGGLYLEQYSSLNYTFKGGKTFTRSENGDKLTGGPERKHLTSKVSAAVSTKVHFYATKKTFLPDEMGYRLQSAPGRRGLVTVHVPEVEQQVAP